MAPRQTTSLSASAQSPTLSPALALAGLAVACSVLVELPEVAMLAFAFAYAMHSGKKQAMLMWWKKNKVNGLMFICCAVVAIAVVYEMKQLALVFISALCYLAVYELGKKQAAKKTVACDAKPSGSLSSRRVPKAPPSKRSAPVVKSDAAPCKLPEVDAKTRSVTLRSEALGALHQEPRPLLDAVFDASGLTKASSTAASWKLGRQENVDLSSWTSDVEKTIRREFSTAADDGVARKLAAMVRKSVSAILGEAEVSAVPCGNLTIIGEAGEKPEVDVVLSIDTGLLKQCLLTYFAKGQTDTRNQKSNDSLNPDVIMRTAARVLSERFEGLRFWRSQFTGPEIKIVLLVPVALGFFNHPIRLNFSVNTPYPLRLVHLFSRGDSRSKNLMLFVKRWADERGINKSTKGHLHPYAWGLLAINFMRCRQVEEEDEVEQLTISLFHEFVNFYHQQLNVRNKAVHVSFTGQSLQRSGESMLWDIPCIEDPFDSAVDAAKTMTADGVARLKEELTRARSILARGERATLAQLLQKWTPAASPQSVAGGSSEAARASLPTVQRRRQQQDMSVLQATK